MSIEIVTDAMRAHANKLNGIANSGAEGVAAAEYTKAQGDNFGILCSFIGEVLAPVQEVGATSAKSAVFGIAATAEALRAVAAGFDAADEAIAEAWDAFRGGE